MKKIEAIILPAKLEAVRTEFERRGIHVALTLTEVQQTGFHQAAIPAEQETTEFLEDRLKMELIVGDRQAQKALDVIMKYAQVAANRIVGHVALLRVNEVYNSSPPLSNKLEYPLTAKLRARANPR